MNKITYILLTVCLLAFSAFGQRLVKPTEASIPLTAAQRTVLREGVALHDAKKYDEAISKYQSILTESPNATVAMYEMAMTLFTKGEKDKALELATIGSKYISDELPLFYVTIANVLDDKGKPQEAIKIYQNGLKLLEGDGRFNAYRASLFHNLGVTYLRQKKNNEARAAFKSAVENNFSYPSPHYLLAVVFNGTRYRVPAFLAAARLISLEYNTQRTALSVEMLATIFEPSSKDANGNISINLDVDAPKDEGEFAMYDFILPTLTTIDDKKKEQKSANEKFIDAIDTVVTMLGEDKKLKSTFVGKTYVPYMLDLKKAGHLAAFGNMVLYIRNNKNADAAKWVNENGTKLESFLLWAKQYQLAKN